MRLLRLEEIEEDIRRGEEELERAIGSYGMFNVTSF
jgi:exonuclease VII small subunit